MTTKICDLIKQKEAEKKPYFSFEYFPPKTDQGVVNLYSRMDIMSHYGPLFADVTWGAGGRTSDLTTELCIRAKKYCGMEPQMHLTCTNMDTAKIDIALKECKENGLCNILALRGDPPRGEKKWTATEGGFSYAVDLVKYIRKEYGDYFSIAVAGYPEKHCDAPSYEEDIQRLKEKVDAGADVVITQLFYDVHIFLKFVKDCRDVGITVPILPGLMPLRSYAGLLRMCELCGSAIPQKVIDDCAGFKDDDHRVQEYGVAMMVEMCQILIKNGIYGLHFYTLNQEKLVTQILLGLGLVDKKNLNKPTPWFGTRDGEDVRPIFWANRPKTYMSRTSDWDEYPNGRWGDSGSPSFSTLDIYHLNLYRINDELRIKEWGRPRNLTDVAEVFVSYLNGKISSLPWNNTRLAAEAGTIFSQLKNMNAHGFFTINSQPHVNASPSDHPIHGWGPDGGYVWQKAYIEFFCSGDHLEKLKSAMIKYPHLQLHAINRKGVEFKSGKEEVTAVTWGVWPGSEVKQPTIVDNSIFHIWKDEAFELWNTEWAALYPEGDESRKVIEDIADSFYLVNIIDNDFIEGDIFSIFEDIIVSEALILAEIEEDKKEKAKALEERLFHFEKEKAAFEEQKKKWEAEHK